MNAEIINTGTEILLGSILNTHLVFLGQELFGLGFRISRQISIPDGAVIRTALEEAFARQPDLILVTGGLGPTTDDLTRDLLAEMLGSPLIENEEILGMITARFARRNLQVSPRVRLQALVPAGVHPILNHWGTAPGLHLPASEKNPHTFFLPGPPRELRPMFTEAVVPTIRAAFPKAGGSECRIWRIAGLGESMVEEKIGGQLAALPDLEFGYCARSGEVDVRVIGSPEVTALAAEIVENAFPDSIYARDQETMEGAVIRLLRESSLTVATAESCTGGLLANRLTNVPGASEVFIEGHITYANAAKARTLGIDPALIDEHGAVSEPVAAAMAAGARRIAGTDFALSTTGIAGPGGGTESKPVGTIFIGLADAHGVEVTQHRFPTDRETFKYLVTQTALERLRQSLRSGQIHTR